VVWYITDAYLTPDVQLCDYAQILDIHCETSLESPFWWVTGGYIKLRGYTVQMQFEDKDGCYSHGRLKITRPRDMLYAEDNASTESNIRESVSRKPDPSESIAEAIEERRKTPKETSRSDDETLDGGSYVCIDAVEDMLEARSKIVTCLDIMRDKDTERFISGLVLLPVDGKPGTYRRVGLSTMAVHVFQGAEMTDVTII
jgi:hypothetical protein